MNTTPKFQPKFKVGDEVTFCFGGPVMLVQTPAWQKNSLQTEVVYYADTYVDTENYVDTEIKVLWLSEKVLKLYATSSVN